MTGLPLHPHDMQTVSPEVTVEDTPSGGKEELMGKFDAPGLGIMMFSLDLP